MGHEETSTKQVDETRDERGRFTSGHKPSTGFHTNPERRSNGRWKKEDSISFQYNLLLSMSPEEFDRYKPDTIAQKIALARVKDALLDDRNAFVNTIEITDRTEGKACQEVEIKDEEKSSPLIKGFVIPSMPDDYAARIDREINEALRGSC